MKNLKIYTIESNALDVHLQDNVHDKDTSLTFSSAEYDKGGQPLGFYMYKGFASNKPALSYFSEKSEIYFVKYLKGDVEMRQNIDLSDHAYTTKWVTPGLAPLVIDGKAVIEETADLPPDVRISTEERYVCLGLEDGKIVMFTAVATFLELVNLAKNLEFDDAMVISASSSSYVRENRKGVSIMGDKVPLTVFKAKQYKELERPFVVIDAGHGGKDPGATGLGLKEKDVNLDIAKRVIKYLNKNYVGTFMLTRDKDMYLSLNDRSKMANNIDADFFLSIHSNGFNGRAKGYETYSYDHGSDMSHKMSKLIHNEVMKVLKPLGVVDRGTKKANFHVIRETYMPAVLVENLFIDNVDDNKMLRESHIKDAIAVAISKAIGKGYELQRVVTTMLREDKKDEYYRVQCGAFTYKKGAETLAQRLENDGYDTYIVKY